MLWLWLFISGLILIIILLLIKIHLLRKSAQEIESSFSEKLITDSNTLIDISSNDKYMRHLANEINIQLRKLQAERRKFQKGETVNRYIAVIRNRTKIQHFYLYSRSFFLYISSAIDYNKRQEVLNLLFQYFM